MLRLPISGVMSLPLCISLIINPALVLAHAGHGNEFKGSSTTQTSGISVDQEAAKRLGIKAEPVKRQTLKLAIKTTGQIETLPSQKAKVTTPIKGTILALLVEPNQKVEAGQPVAVLSSPELAGLQVEAIAKQSEADGNAMSAIANLQLAEQNLARQKSLVEADILQAQTELNLDKERYDRDRELFTQGAITKRQVQESESKYVAAKSALAKASSRLPVLEAEAQMSRATADVQVARSRISLSGAAYEARRNQLGAISNPDGTVTVVSPIAGVVSDREATLGESVEESGKPIMTIVNDRQVMASANIYEKDLSQVRIGQAVQVKVAGDNTSFVGKVTAIGATVDSTTRVVPVKAEINNAQGKLKVGMFVDLEIISDRASQPVITVPFAAVVESNGKQLVFVQNGTKYQPVEVKLGRTSGDLVEVQDGLFEGDLVVTQRANQIYAQSLRGDAQDHKSNPNDDHHGSEQGGSTISQGWLVIAIALGAIGGGAIVALAFWLGRRSGTKMVILREPSETSDQINR
ncbi:efflux RND transporter periplasmic adaptor subunit [Pseudanabaena sp. UWO311]|uniref:efflux RND transporter periplasmic adaptor subunit n=1 Tax=Pseudanabaena sp. UWO311 TaxID=2487337 RepID=UPI001159AA66|nr:efflux RND transporter periplasmic adaptor subunit [Pseudanabaena sp. UWO311]TYQ23303.1 efflux RND transporter periplasmic adaptor subunit [Pseudanabaena sp. UWO311]